ncbi:FkbM family methyltransferase [Actinoplanes sp. ATCC 53533]|uniref:FkbM family methyltransferase n=1 Tax=Actinoplanes sp. ATCC 53533 TaxID=1288362 RepID=UPI000F76F954|nr:FkbM family methyltransferase [Actinoplanes sp. ATCC 53533]
MLVRNLLPLISGVGRIVDVSPGAEDLRRHLMVPGDLPYSAVAPAAVADTALTSDDLLLCLLGPREGTHTPAADLGRALHALPAGVKVLILAGWSPEDFPQQVVLQMLADGHCQLADAVPVDSSGRYGMEVALLAERVEKIQPRRAHLADAPAGDEALPPDVPGADQLPMQLWLANQSVLGELVTGTLLHRVHALGDRVTQLTAQMAAARETVAEAKQTAAEAKAAKAARDEDLTRAKKQIRSLKSSLTFRLGQTLVDGARHPGKGVVTVPVTMAKIWRDRRARTSAPEAAPQPVKQPAKQPVKATHRSVPIPVPGKPGRALTMTAPVDLMVPRKLAQNGLHAYESSAVPCFLAAIGAAGPGAVLDIGANVGLYAALAAACSDREVVAFEPFPTLSEVAERLSADNDLNFRVESIALGSETGQATLYLSNSSDSSNSLAAGFRESTRQIEVPVETLDAYVRRTGVVPAVLKIDTESTEPDVLFGSAETLRDHRPWVLCEVLAGRGEDRLTEAMAPHGYHWFHITSEVPYAPAQDIAGDRTYKDLMWLFAPEAPDESFWAAVAAHRASIVQAEQAPVG